MTWRRFHPDPSAVHFDNPLDQGEPDAGAVDLWVQFIEQSEDTLVEFRGDADPIIAYKKDRV